MKPNTVLLLLVLLCGLLFFSRLGAVAFYEEDEPRFAAAARSMVESGDYLTPRFNGKLRINKPILFYWCAAASDAVFGANEFGARFPSALFGMGTVLLLFLFARAYGGARFGALAALILATCLQISLLARAATADMGMIFFFTAALLAFFRAYTTGARKYVLLFWAALGMAALAKGPAFLVLAGAVILLFVLAQAIRNPKSEIANPLRLMVTPVGLLVFVLIAVPWYAAELWVHGETFYRGFFLAEHIGRYRGEADPHRGPVVFYLGVMLLMFFPWVCFLPAGLSGMLRARAGEDQQRLGAPAGLSGVLRARADAMPLRLFALCWVVVVLGIFSFSGTKLPHYIAPLYPAAALLVAWAWERRLAGEEWRAWRASVWFLAVWGCLLTGGLGYLLMWRGPALLGGITGGPPPEVGSAPLALVLLFGLAWLGGTVALMMRRPAGALAALAGSMAAAILCVHLAVAPVVARYWQDPVRDLAVEAASRAGAKAQLALFAYASSDIVYYSRRTVVRVRKEDAGRLAAMAARAPLFVLTTVRRLPDLPPNLPLREVRRDRGFVLLGPAEGAAR